MSEHGGAAPAGMKRWRWALTAVAAVAAVVFSVGALAAPASSADIDANDLLMRVEAAVAADPLLEGALLRLDRDDAPGSPSGPAGIVFTRVFDAIRADRQAAAMERIMQELVPAGRFRVDTARDVRLPVTELKSAVERLIAQDTVRFDGCRVLSIRLGRNRVDGRVVVVPRFRVVRPGQFAALIAECNQIMSRSPAWVAAEVSAVDNQPDQTDLAEEEPTPDPNVVLQRVVEAARSNPDLRGAWLTVDTDDQGFPGVAARLIVFRRTLDAGRAEVQSAAIKRLVRSLVPAGRFRIDTAKDRRLPLSKLVAEMRRIIDIDPAFAGCAIESVAYVPSTNDAEQRFDILLQGRVWKQEQVDRIVELCGTLLSRDPAWAATRAGVSVESAKTLAVVPPDPAMAAAQYSDAMHHFWAGDYDGADRRLAMASLDDPANIVYRYWRTIGSLASGDRGGAEERLRQTVVGFGVRHGSAQYLEVLRSIYRIQGPLRMSLIEAERRVMTDASLGVRHSGMASAL